MFGGILVFKESFLQFILYALIGGLNVLLDFGFLNIMMILTGINKGYMLFVFNALSFIVYSTNGYLLNKKFTFKSSQNSYFKYISVLGTAMILNGIILSNLTLHNFASVNPLLWANISKLIASMTTGTLSFIVNKFFVFKKDPQLKS
jgi:putative flippase GtrA